MSDFEKVRKKKYFAKAVHLSNRKTCTKTKIHLLNFNIGGLSLRTSQRLVDHDAGIREGLALSFCSGPEEEGSHTCGHTEANRLNIAWNELHGIVNCQSCTDGSSRRIDVQSNILIGIFVC